MRISPQEILIFKKALAEIDPEARLFLFGSRTDDLKKGGDIDLLILSSSMDYSHKILFLTKVFNQIEEQKIDVVLKNDKTDPFINHIMKQSILL